jgi:hypothetical protein
MRLCQLPAPESCAFHLFEQPGNGPVSINLHWSRRNG